MKDKIHPVYTETIITCACGNIIHTRSTKENIRVDICSNCHPFFTGKQKLVDAAGRVERFKKRYARKKPKEAPKEVIKEAPEGAQTADKARDEAPDKEKAAEDGQAQAVEGGQAQAAEGEEKKE